MNTYWADITVKVLATDKTEAEKTLLDAALYMEKQYGDHVIIKGTEVEDT